MLKFGVLITFCTLLLQTAVLAADSGTRISEPQTNDRIAHEVVQQSGLDKRTGSLLSDEEDDEEGEKRGWIKRHPVIAGMPFGAGGGAVVGLVVASDSKADLTEVGGMTIFAVFGVPIGALVGKVASEY